MQFVVTGYDGTDEGALDRRMAVRGDHMNLVEIMKAKGHFLYACALVDESDKMIGSVMTVEFESREQLDEWLKIEPYVLGGVWKNIEVKPCKIPPIFRELNNK